MVVNIQFIYLKRDLLAVGMGSKNGWLLTKAIHKLKDFISMVYFRVVHHRDTQGSSIGSAIWQLPRELSCGYCEYTKNKLITLNSRYSRNPVFIIDSSTTVPAIIPSKVRSASVGVCLPLTRACFLSAHLPFLDCPKCLLGVLSSFDVSSRNPSSSGLYCATHPTKSACKLSFHYFAIHLTLL